MLENPQASRSRASDILVQEFDLQELRDVLHTHDSYEFCLVLRGRGTWRLGQVQGRFEPGTGLLCPPGSLHAWEGDADATFSGIVLRFTRSCLPDALLELEEASRLRELSSAMSMGLRFAVADRERMRSRLRSIVRASGALRLARFLVALELISESSYSQVVEKEDFVNQSERDLVRWDALQKHFSERFTKPFSRTDAAALVGLEAASFSRFFRRVAGVGFASYLAQMRVQRAAQLLGNRRDLSLADVAKMSGFGSEISLYRQFRRRLGTTPEAYRKAADAEVVVP